MVAGAFMAILGVPLLGGRFGRLRHTKLVEGWLMVLGLGIQVVILQIIASMISHEIAAGLHVLSYLFTFGFVYANRRVAGLWLIALGGLMNLAAIVANGGVMPASPAAVARAGHVVSAEFTNSALIANARLGWLGDAHAIPKGFPLANVFSLGDVIIVVGAAVVLWQATGTILFRRQIPRALRYPSGIQEEMTGGLLHAAWSVSHEAQSPAKVPGRHGASVHLHNPQARPVLPPRSHRP